jgi:hypothetical protein
VGLDREALLLCRQLHLQYQVHLERGACSAAACALEVLVRDRCSQRGVTGLPQKRHLAAA